MNNALTMAAPAAPKAKSKPKAESDSDNRGELNCIKITPTENGFSVCSYFDPEKIDAKRDMYSQMPEDEEMSFESGPAALAYVTKMMSEHGSYESEDKKSAA